MDKSYVVPYPQVEAKNDADSVENRLNASREAIRLRLKASDTNEAFSTQSDSEDAHTGGSARHEKPINSWSSLLMSFIAPSAKKVMTQHPYTLIGSAAVIGAYLAWAKPWRGVLGSVLVGAVIRNLVTASVSAGSRNGGRILRHYLNRAPEKKYPRYQKQEHASARYDA